MTDQFKEKHSDEYIGSSPISAKINNARTSLQNTTRLYMRNVSNQSTGTDVKPQARGIGAELNKIRWVRP